MKPVCSGLLAFSPLQASDWPQSPGSARSWAPAEATARKSHPRQTKDLCSLHKPPQPQLCPWLYYTFHHQPTPIKKENQTGRDSQGQARAPVPAAALWAGRPKVQVSAAQRPALSDGGRRDPSRTEAPPPAGRPDTGHPSSHHGLLCGQECQCFGLPLSINHPVFLSCWWACWTAFYSSTLAPLLLNIFFSNQPLLP